MQRRATGLVNRWRCGMPIVSNKSYNERVSIETTSRKVPPGCESLHTVNEALPLDFWHVPARVCHARYRQSFATCSPFGTTGQAHAERGCIAAQPGRLRQRHRVGVSGCEGWFLWRGGSEGSVRGTDRSRKGTRRTGERGGPGAWGAGLCTGLAWETLSFCVWLALYHRGRICFNKY